MLSPRWRKVVRDIWLHKSRTSLVVLAISVGIVGAGTVLNAWSLLRRVTREEFGASNPASATLRTNSIDAAILARVRAMPAIANAEARRVVTASIQTGEGSRTAMLFALPDASRNTIGVVKRDAGAWPPTDGSLVVEHSSREFAAIQLGDSVSVQVPTGTPVALPVSGVARDVGLAPGWMEHVVYGFVTTRTLAMLGAPTSLNEMQIVVRDRSLDRDGVRRVVVDVKTLMESAGHTVSDVNIPVPGRHIHAGQIDSLLYTQGAFGLMALFLSGILVVNLIAAMLTGQVREIGVMKSLGARPNQIAGMYLGLAFVLGLIACAISIPSASVLGRLYAEFTAEMLNFDVTPFRIPAWSYAIQLATGMLLPIVAAAIPVARGCRVSVADALRDLGIGTRGESGPSWLLHRTSGLSRPLLLSLRNAFRRRQRMMLTLGALATGGAVYLGAINLRASIVGSVDLVFSAQKYDMSVRFARAYSPDSLVQAASRVAGVSRSEAWSGVRASIGRGDGLITSSFAVMAPPLGSPLLDVQVERGRWLAGGTERELVVNTRVLDDNPELDVGSAVTLVIGGKPSQWRIVGIAATGPSPVAYSARETVSAVTGESGATGIVVQAEVKGRGSQLDLVRRLRDELTHAGFEVTSSQLLEAQRAVVEDHLLMVAGFLGNMSLLMIVVGGLGLASTMSLAVLERTREIGILRAIGARHGSILAMVQVEGLVIALLSWLVAIPLSLPMSVALAKAFGRIMLKTPVNLLPEASGVVRWLAVVVVVSIVSCAWPAFRAMRVPTAKALAFE